ncbi:tetratricopeptide repeat protein [Marinifilum sp.]|uniref:tetratricopeptide repeat protein n=1 Tax=Marinifilum sp. TaxID=2033137 RepID=UPI003BAA4915
MSRFIPLFLFWIFQFSNGFCDNRIDSLLRISTHQAGKDHLETYLKIAEHFSYGNNGDTIIFYAEKCYKEAISFNDSLAILKTNLYWGSGLYSSKQYKKSLQKVEAGFLLADQLNRPKEKLQIHYLRARNFQGLKHYDKAIDAFKNGYYYSIKLLNTDLHSFASRYFDAFLKQLTYTYWYAAKLEDGISYLHKSLEKNRSLSDLYLRAYYANLAFLYNCGIDYKKAEYYLLKAAEISNKWDTEDQIYMDQAYLGALYSNLGDNHKAIAYYERAMDIAKKQNDNHKISYLLQNLGLCYDLSGNLKKGVDMIFDGIRIFIDNKDNNAIAKAYQQLGRLMIKWKNGKDADKYLHHSLKMHKEAKLYYLAIVDYINLVESKILQHNRDSAEHYLNILKEQAQAHQSKSSECTYHLHKSLILLQFDHKPNTALVHIKKAKELSDQTNSKTLKTYTQKMFGEYYLQINLADSAAIHLQRAWNQNNSISIIQDKSNIAQSLSNAYKKLNELDNAYFYLQKADSINKRIHDRENVLMLYKKDNEFTVQQVKHEKKALNQENKRLSNRIILIRSFYILLSLNLISLLVMYMRRRTKRLQSEIHIKETVQEKLEQQSIIDKSTIEKNKELIKIKEETIEQLKDKISNTQNSSTSNGEMNELECLLNSKLTTEEDWDDYLLIFSKKNSNFIPDLKSRFPNLSRNEIKIFTLIKLGLNKREMSGILMISPSSVNTARYRLRKKLNMTANQKLEDLIEEMAPQKQD